MAVWYIQIRVSILHIQNICFLQIYLFSKCNHLLYFIVSIENSYTLDDLLKEKSYLVTMEIKSCFESADPQCDASESYTVFNKTLLPKTECIWKSGFKESGKK